MDGLATAAQPNGDKSPRHKDFLHHKLQVIEKLPVK
jgi:hypothetical protein